MTRLRVALFLLLVLPLAGWWFLPLTAWWHVLFSPTDLDVPPLPYVLSYTDGAAVLEPDHVRAGSSGNHLTLSLTLGPEAIQPGGRIVLMTPSQVIDLEDRPHLYVPQVNGLPPFQADDPDADGYLSLDPVPGPARVRLALVPRRYLHPFMAGLLRGSKGLEPYSPKEMQARLVRYPVTVSDAPLPGGSTLVFRVGGAAGQGGFSATPRETRIRFAVLIDARGDGDLKLLRHTPTLTVTGQVAEAARVLGPSIVRPDPPFEVTLRAVDRHGARDPGFVGVFTLKVRGIDAGWTVPFAIEHRGERRWTIPGLPAGNHWLEVTGVASAGHAPAPAGSTAGPTLPGPATAGASATLIGSIQPVIARADGPLLWWGDTHRHSILADGQLPPEEVYRQAIEEERLDWVCLSEHSHPDVYDRFGAYKRRLTLTRAEWKYLVGLSDRIDALDHFTSITGYEWTSREGHRNVYFHPDERPEPLLSHYTLEGRVPVETFLRTFEGRRVFVVPHHPAWRLGDGESYRWGPSELANGLQRLVEVYSQHGNSEFFDNPRPIHAGPTAPRPPPFPFARQIIGDALLGPEDQAPENAPGFVRSALARGYRMGLIASSDNHFFPTGEISYPGGYAAVWAATNDRASIWTALNDRAAFGTTGPRMVLELEVSGLRAGQSGRIAGVPEVRARVLGTAGLRRVEVVRFDRNGYHTAAVREARGEEASIDLIDTAFAGPGFYFLRVEQADGNLGWAGPVWID